MSFNKRIKRRRGAIALVTLLLISSVLTVAGVSLIFLNIDLNKTTKNFYTYEHAKFRAQSCMEDALIRINKSFTFTGSGTIPFPNGSCIYVVANDAAPNMKVISITSSFYEYYYKQSVKADLSSGNIVIVY